MTEVELLYMDLSARTSYGLICNVYKVDDAGVGWRQFYTDMTETVSSYELGKIVQWFNKHHIDYNGLIPRQIALEAPADMYKFE